MTQRLAYSDANVTAENQLAPLVEALDTGWEIEEPVLRGYSWNTARQQAITYHFILRGNDERHTKLVSLPENPQLDQFLASRQLDVQNL